MKSYCTLCISNIFFFVVSACLYTVHFKSSVFLQSPFQTRLIKTNIQGATVFSSQFSHILAPRRLCLREQFAVWCLDQAREYLRLNVEVGISANDPVIIGLLDAKCWEQPCVKKTRLCGGAFKVSEKEILQGEILIPLMKWTYTMSQSENKKGAGKGMTGRGCCSRKRHWHKLPATQYELTRYWSAGSHVANGWNWWQKGVCNLFKWFWEIKYSWWLYRLQEKLPQSKSLIYSAVGTFGGTSLFSKANGKSGKAFLPSLHIARWKAKWFSPTSQSVLVLLQKKQELRQRFKANLVFRFSD